MSGFLTRDKFFSAPPRHSERAGTELLLQPRFRLFDQTLIALEATAARPRSRLHRAISSGRETRDLGRDGAMLREAFRLAAGWRSATPPNLAFRVTEAQAASGMLAQLIGEVLRDTGLAPERVELEFSEGSLEADECDMLYLLAALRDIGVGLVMGGFGGGISSLTLLRRRSLAGLLSALKLDAILVRELGTEDGDTAFLKGLADSAHALGLLVLAEGIESEPHHYRLLRAGCDQGLGTWLGEPLPAAECIRAGSGRGVVSLRFAATREGDP